MGIVRFQGHKDKLQYLFEEVLYDLNDDEDLASVHMGDSIALVLEIDQQTFSQLSENTPPGILARKRALVPLEENPAFEVEISFTVVKRVHYVTRDWMSEGRGGFRSSSTTVYLESTTDEGERLFIALQKQYNDLYQS